MERLKKVEEYSKERHHLLAINGIVNNYLMSRFNKTADFYLKTQQQKKQKSVWDTIEFIENVSKFTVYNEIKDAIINYQQNNNINYIIFSAKEVKTTKKPIYITFPFFSEYQIKIWNPETHVFVVRDFQFITNITAVKAEVISNASKLFEEIISKAISLQASDIHLIPKEGAYFVYFRINGFFIEQKELKLNLDDGDNLITYLLRRCATETKGSQFNPDTRLIYQDARITLTEFGNYDARLAFIPDGYTLRNMEVVIRLLKKQMEYISSDETVENKLLKLGYLKEDINVLINILSKNKGVCVISGITNSGKSTLVNVLLSSIRTKKVGSVEDPVEYSVSNSNFMQHQLFLSEDEKLKMDFVDYIKAFKRADYDIVFIGEWRNHPGLTEAIIEMSFAGQLIITTLHIANSFQIFESLKHMYNVSPEQLKVVLLLSWNQTLFPKLCEHCKQKVTTFDAKKRDLIRQRIELSVVLDEKTKNKLENFLQRPLADLYERGQGCPNCHYTGYSGRQVVYDYFVPNYNLLNALTDYSYADVLSKAEQYTKMKTKIDVFLHFVKAGVLSIYDITGNEYVASLV